MNRPAEDKSEKLSAPTMGRSRNQLASAYSPGAFFTFEGGLGACLAVPHPDSVYDKATITEETKEQILLRLREIWSTWYRITYGLNQADRTIFPEQCIDRALLRNGELHPLPGSSLEFISPLKMGYGPAPLTFVCNTCGLFRDFDSAKEFEKSSFEMSGKKCPNPKEKGRCQWRQLDVIFVHWSGSWAPASPGMWEWKSDTGEPRRFGESCSSCGSRDFKLNTNSPRIGEWFFQCASCGNKERDSWLQNDRETTSIFRDAAGTRISERRMEPISYRASSAYYPQAETFVVFGENQRDLLSLLGDGRTAELENFIAKQYGFGATRPPIEEMLDSLRQAGRTSEVETYESLSSVVGVTEQVNPAAAAKLKTELEKTVQRWFDEGLIAPKNELPGALRHLITMRSLFSSRYDPFVLAVEHECLRRTKLERTVATGELRPYVRFVALDKRLSPKDEGQKAKQEAETATHLSRLGIEEMGLISEFDLCRFTHGYTRVNATPTFEKRKQTMPVRLNLFDPLPDNKRPIYVVTQGNEAIYVRLRADDVHAWLCELGLAEDVPWSPESAVKLGGFVLQTAAPFGRYFSDLRADKANVYRYVYTLLHTYAHTLMKAIAEHSGLDLGSLGEYLFPADLAFVVYRNGTTMDLGNLSSLWRNENNRFLLHLLQPKTHSCNSGSLCDFSGGACPDCIMVPETSCLAGNNLLSRAVLRGGPAPREDSSHGEQRIKGFFTLANERHHRG